MAWLYGGLRRFLPAEYARFRDAVPAGLRDSDLVQVYNELLNSPDPAVRQHAADEWMAWEDAVVGLDPDSSGPSAKRADPRYRLAFARLCAHYFSHGAWLREGQLLPRRTGCAASRAPWCTAGSIRRDRWRPPGCWPRPGRTPSC